MYSLVVSLVVVVGAIVGILWIVESGNEQPATARHRHRRETAAAPVAPSPTDSTPPTGAGAPAQTSSRVTPAEPAGRMARLRSAAALALLLTCVGAALAALVGASLVLLDTLLRHAAGSGVDGATRAAGL